MAISDRMPRNVSYPGWGYVLLILLAVSCSSPAHRLNKEGVELARAGHYQEALRKFEAADDAAPEWVEIQLNLARTHLLLDQPQLALAPAKTAAQLDPDNLEAQLILAQTYLLLKQKPEAENILQRLTDRYPKNYFLFMALGDLAMASRDWPRAIERYRRSIEIDDKSDRANLQLGRAYLYKEISSFRADIPVALPQTKDPRTMMARAGQLIASGGIDLEQARVCFHRAVYLNPQNSQAHLMLGLLAFYTASYQEAEMELSQALKQEPRNGFLLMALALNAQKMGKLDQAATHLQQAVELMPQKMEPRIIQIFLEIERKNYPLALNKIKKMIATHPQTQQQFFQTFASNPFVHVPWLIDQLPDDFCAQSLAFISKRPSTPDKQQWQQWWSQEEKRLQQEIKDQSSRVREKFSPAPGPKK